MEHTSHCEGGKCFGFVLHLIKILIINYYKLSILTPEYIWNLVIKFQFGWKWAWPMIIIVFYFLIKPFLFCKISYLYLLNFRFFRLRYFSWQLRLFFLFFFYCLSFSSLILEFGSLKWVKEIIVKEDFIHLIFNIEISNKFVLPGFWCLKIRNIE